MPKSTRIALTLTVMSGLIAACEPSEEVKQKRKARDAVWDVAATKAQQIAEAEAYAAVCGLRLNRQLRDDMRADALVEIGGSAVVSLEDSTRTRTLEFLRQYEGTACMVGLIRFGPIGEKVKDLLLAP